MRTLKVLGFLLTYPSAQQIEVLSECREILRNEKWIPDAALRKLNRLMEWMEGQDILDLQEEYVALFDRTPSLSLHLFEHVHGDSRDRGPALVNLTNIYKDAGLVITTDEMPDYLPLFLEYLSILSPEEARENLDGAINVIAAIGERLKNRESHYAGVFEALSEAAHRKPDPKAIEEALKKNSGKAHSFEELDEEWKEQFAFENTPQTTQGSGCPSAREMVERMNRPIDPKSKKELPK
ncbi:MAG: nitrate reductase molybdenum cofactor assembly chaperone [Micavibrio sp.]|nr:nitrate reductase molybdenum cofactor assembly chaperone [Micavibrio sp.]MBK9562089.1 nitrate reductase molybdenum cofactor assembly chaperone [Micavibrio sp.]